MTDQTITQTSEHDFNTQEIILSEPMRYVVSLVRKYQKVSLRTAVILAVMAITTGLMMFDLSHASRWLYALLVVDMIVLSTNAASIFGSMNMIVHGKPRPVFDDYADPQKDNLKHNMASLRFMKSMYAYVCVAPMVSVVLMMITLALVNYVFVLAAEQRFLMTYALIGIIVILAILSAINSPTYLKVTRYLKNLQVANQYLSNTSIPIDRWKYSSLVSWCYRSWASL